MKNRLKCILFGIMLSAFSFGIMPMAQVNAEVGLRDQDGTAVITDFEQFDVNENALHLLIEEKPSLDELLELMPDTLDVYYNDSDIPETLDVDWYCVGEDYENSESFYFQFSPTWDEESYVLSEEIDLLTEAPYMAVFFMSADSGISTMAVTNNSYEPFIFDYLTDVLGYNTAAACGAMANIYSESAFVPINLENIYETKLGFTDLTYTMAVDDGSYKNFVRDSAGYGLCQWTYYTRKQGLLDYAKSQGKSIGDAGMQLSFLNKELMAGSTGKYMKAAPNTEQGTYNVGYYFCQNFERPAQVADEKSIARGNLAKNYYWEEYSDSIDYSISITGHNKPGNMMQGKSFNITGTITSGARIRNLTVGIFDPSGNMVSGKKGTPNVKTCQLADWDAYVKFESLKPGVYTYRVIATNASQTKTMVEQPFVVYSNSNNFKEGTYMIVPMVNRSMVLSVENHSDELAAKLYQENNVNSEYQYFEISYVGNGCYTLKNVGSGLYLDVPNGKVGKDIKVQQYSYTGANAQKWQIVAAGSNYCLIPQCNTSYSLNVVNGSTVSGANLWTMPINQSKAQQFCLITGDIEEVFRDVSKAEWYLDYLIYVYENGLMSGNDGKFEPNKAVTKAMVAQVLYNLEGKPKADDTRVFTELKDVYKSEWYADAVAWAYHAGIITGDLNTKKFLPNSDVTREQLALMFYRYAAYKTFDTSETSGFDGLANAENVSNWAKEGMQWAVGAKLISGIEIKNSSGVVTSVDLAPQNTATRAQMAAILKRFCEGYQMK